MNTREYWVSALTKIAFPVLDALSRRQLRQEMPLVEVLDEQGHVVRSGTPSQVMYLEALGRTLTGMAPWLEVELPPGEEQALQSTYRQLARAAIDAGTDPDSPDRCLWWDRAKGFEPNQPIVDAAFLAHAILRAPNQLYHQQSERVKKNLIDALLEVRHTRPAGFNNWVLFGAMVETALYLLTGECDAFRIEAALSRHMDWYVGDGTYGDGKPYHWDYYNSFVIHPMMNDISLAAEPILQFRGQGQQIREAEIRRLSRYARVQMLHIAPDGSYPAYGRSITYRMAAFHALAQAALKGYPVKDTSPAQIRCALTKVIGKHLSAPDLFDEGGWLRAGLYGCQPALRESYISTGSLYLCTQAFLPLGLPPAHDFWSMPDEPTAWEKLWSGCREVGRDHEQS
ncbi:MAG: DUF2264 domain-containing protein [Eubacteriales bacterium]